MRVLTRVMKRVGAVAGQVGTQLRDRTRSIKLRVLAIARAEGKLVSVFEPETEVIRKGKAKT